MENENNKNEEKLRACKNEEIFEICKAMFEGEKYFSNEIKLKRNKSTKCYGHLINYSQIKKLKECISYDNSKIKNYFKEKNVDKELILEEIKPTTIPYIDEVNFSNYKKFKQSLKEGKKYAIILEDLWKLVSYKKIAIVPE